MIGILIAWGVPQRFAKPLLIAAGVLLLVAMLSIGKCSYDRAIIRNHTANQRAGTAEADRKADANAAEQRRADDTRANTERTEISNAIEEARASGADPRAAYYQCVQMQQRARQLDLEPARC